MNHQEDYRHYIHLLMRRPYAYAYVKGDPLHPDLYGTVRFFKTAGGILIAADISGLPKVSGACAQRFLGFHIHAGDSCSSANGEFFGATLGHYNPHNCPHPYHSGDLPPLAVTNGHAFSVSLNETLSAEEIIGRTVIIHASFDDFQTQPSGNAGTKIGCGVIRKY